MHSATASVSASQKQRSLGVWSCNRVFCKCMYCVRSVGQRWGPRERSIVYIFDRGTTNCLQFHVNEPQPNHTMEMLPTTNAGRKWLTFCFERSQRWHCDWCGTTHQKWWRSALKPLLCCWLRWRCTLWLLRGRTSHDGRCLICKNRHDDEMGWTRRRWNTIRIPIDCGCCGWFHFHFYLLDDSWLNSRPYCLIFHTLVLFVSPSTFCSFRSRSRFLFDQQFESKNETPKVGQVFNFTKMTRNTERYAK